MEISKNLLAGALSALGKLVCRTSPLEVYRTLRIESKNGTISLQTVGLDEAITCTLPVEGADEFQVFVNFDDFRTLTKYSRNKSVVIGYEEGRLTVDRTPLSTLNVKWPDVATPTPEALTADLPENFVGMLATAAPVVNRHEYRKALQGIHLCKEGMVVTNGKELLHIPFELGLDALTLPFPHALLATKCDANGMLATWRDGGRQIFSITLGHWTWTGAALPGNYPNWRPVIPEASSLNHIVNFDDGRASQLVIFLKNVPANPPNNPVTLTMGDDRMTLDVVAGEMRTSVVTEFPVDWGDFEITVNQEILLRLLNEGHHRLAFGTSNGPFIASGGIGTFVAMPLYQPKEQPVQPKPKEETMNEMPNVVTAPIMQSAAPKLEPETPANPLDDLASVVDDFKTRLRAMFEESTVLSRKVKEVALVQKQKERDFVLARRAIERIRMAI